MHAAINLLTYSTYSIYKPRSHLYWLCTSLRMYYMYSIHMSWFHPLPLCSPGMVTGRVGRWRDQRQAHLLFQWSAASDWGGTRHDPQPSVLQAEIGLRVSATVQCFLWALLWWMLVVYIRTYTCGHRYYRDGTGAHTCVHVHLWALHTQHILCTYVCMLYSSYELLRVTTKAAWDFATCPSLSPPFPCKPLYILKYRIAEILAGIKSGKITMKGIWQV